MLHYITRRGPPPWSLNCPAAQMPALGGGTEASAGVAFVSLWGGLIEPPAYLGRRRISQLDRYMSGRETGEHLKSHHIHPLGTYPRQTNVWCITRPQRRLARSGLCSFRDAACRDTARRADFPLGGPVGGELGILVVYKKVAVSGTSTRTTKPSGSC